MPWRINDPGERGDPLAYPSSRIGVRTLLADRRTEGHLGCVTESDDVDHLDESRTSCTVCNDVRDDEDW
jgi:hypothetical protein